MNTNFNLSQKLDAVQHRVGAFIVRNHRLQWTCRARARDAGGANSYQWNGITLSAASSFCGTCVKCMILPFTNSNTSTIS